ncbi:MAG: starch synthase, partial [Gammaproteobacteria bacterium]
DWDPARDPHIEQHYSADDLSGKAAAKRALLERFDLEPEPGDGPGAPLLGIVSRMTGQKGFELLPDALAVLLKQDGVRLVVLGSGEEKYETYFQWLRDTFPGRVGVYFGYSEQLAHQIEAGSDLFLMPSRYEPCGLNQMYSLRYGTVPVVRRTGGLADTVVDFDAATGEGTGFLFDEFTSEAFFQAARAALSVYRQPDAWRRLMRNGMAQDFSWEARVHDYLSLYQSLLATPQAR